MLLVGAGIICAVAAVFMSNRGFSEHPLAPAQPVSPPRHAGTPPSSNISPQGIAPVEPKSTVSKPPRLAMKFEVSDNYKVMFESLLNGKSDGRNLYALNILASCRNAKEAPALQLTQASASVEQQRARELVALRCGSFSGEEVNGQRQYDLVRDSRMKEDPFQDLINRWAATQADPSQREAVISDVLKSGDPLLMEAISTVFLRPGKSAAYFDGQEYMQEHAAQVVGLAWLAAVCEGTSTPCGAGDRYVVDACAGANVCAANRRELFFQEVGTRFGSDATALFSEVYPKLVKAIQAGDAAAFNR
jgi:hypothetical protein